MEATSEQELTIDRALVRRIVRQRSRLWARIGLVIWGASVAACLALVPRSYTATASIALQQSSGAAALSNLAGLSGSGTKNYLGVLHSYRFAQAAARAANIQTLYTLPTQDAAAEMVQNAVNVDDRKDGLLYISVALPGPAYLEHGSHERTREVRGAARQIARAYIGSMQVYLATSNVDKDAALIREAKKQVKLARDGYDASVRDMSDYVHTHTAILPAAGPAFGKSGNGEGEQSSGAAAGGGLQSLELARGQLEAEIAASQAAQKGAVGLLADSPAGVDALPSEDPLLAEARSQVRIASTQLQNLRVDLADDNPDVVAARARLAVAQARLQTESHSIQTGRTSDTIRLQALQARDAVVTKQIASAQHGVKVSTDQMADLEVLRNEVELRLEVLKATASQYAVLSVQTVGGSNLMDVVDDPRTPGHGSPGLMVLGAASLFITLFVLGLWLALDYARLSRRQGATASAHSPDHPLSEAA